MRSISDGSIIYSDLIFPISDIKINITSVPYLNPFTLQLWLYVHAPRYTYFQLHSAMLSLSYNNLHYQILLPSLHSLFQPNYIT